MDESGGFWEQLPDRRAPLEAKEYEVGDARSGDKTESESDSGPETCGCDSTGVVGGGVTFLGLECTESFLCTSCGDGGGAAEGDMAVLEIIIIKSFAVIAQGRCNGGDLASRFAVGSLDTPGKGSRHTRHTCHIIEVYSRRSPGGRTFHGMEGGPVTGMHAFIENVGVSLAVEHDHRRVEEQLVNSCSIGRRLISKPSLCERWPSCISKMNTDCGASTLPLRALRSEVSEYARA